MAASPKFSGSRIELADKDELEEERSAAVVDAADKALLANAHDEPIRAGRDEIERIRIPAAVEIPGHHECSGPARRATARVNCYLAAQDGRGSRSRVCRRHQGERSNQPGESSGDDSASQQSRVGYLASVRGGAGGGGGGAPPPAPP